MEEQHRLVSDANYCYHLEAQDYSFRKKRNCLAMLFTSPWDHGHESWQLSQESDVCYGKSQLSVVFAKTYYFLCAVCFRWLKCTSCMKGLLNWQRCSTLCFVQFVVFINCLRGKQNCIRFETCGSRCEQNLCDGANGLPTFRYALAHHKSESFTALPPESRKGEYSTPISDQLGKPFYFIFLYMRRVIPPSYVW